MLALAVRYLTRYAVATDVSKQTAEWPPHPGRIFMAMAAAFFEAGSDPAEREALEWLEQAPAPALCASGADERTNVRTYVPVNDEHGGIMRRSRQDRAFPRTRPHDDCVELVWQVDPPADVRAALDRVCGKVTRIGHSSSVTQMWVVASGQERAPNWLPSDSGTVRLRVAGRGTLRYLEEAFNAQEIEEYAKLSEALNGAKGKQKARLKAEIEASFPDGQPESRRPQLTNWRGYAPPQSTASGEEASGPFDRDFVVLAKVEGPALGLESTLKLTKALRNASMSSGQDPEWLSGHDAAGRTSTRPHVAFFPLPFVGSTYADGHVMGLGIAVPRDLGPDVMSRADELRRVFGRLLFDPETGEERPVRLWEDKAWEWSMERETRERPPGALRVETWTRASVYWASVTPVVLHHYPKKRDGEVERIVRDAFVSALLPAPEAVAVRSVSAVRGAGHALAVPPFEEGGASLCRYQTHVVARFAQPVRGPMLVGRARYRGYGLFRPITEDEARVWQI